MKHFFILLFFVPLMVNAQISDTAIKFKPKVIQKLESPAIPMNVLPGTMQLRLLPPPGYAGYDIKSMVWYTPQNLYDPNKLHLNLSNLTPPIKLIDALRENPVNALLLGGAIVLGSLNNRIYGEDKMMKINITQGVQSRSGIPESAKSASGAITVKNE